MMLVLEHCATYLDRPVQSSARSTLGTQVNPKGDLVLAKVAEAEEKTLGGVLLPDSAQKKPTSGRAPTPITHRLMAWCC